MASEDQTICLTGTAIEHLGLPKISPQHLACQPAWKAQSPKGAAVHQVRSILLANELRSWDHASCLDIINTRSQLSLLNLHGSAAQTSASKSLLPRCFCTLAGRLYLAHGWMLQIGQ